MSKFITVIRLRRALLNLQKWRERVDKQGAQHLLGFLALKRSGVSTTAFSKHTEQNDKAFCDDFLRVRQGTEPYYDPVAGQFRIHTHYHSNVATARKGTFQGTWKAAQMQGSGGDESWKLAPGYLDILKAKLLMKAGTTTPLPLFDIVSWLYRTKEFPDTASKQTLVEQFTADFHISDGELATLFSTRNLDGTQPTDAEFFSPRRLDPDLLLELLADPAQFDLSEAITELAIQRGNAPVKETEILQLIQSGRRQLILQGPPGTGKTRCAKRLFGLARGLSSEELSDEVIRKYFLDPGAQTPPQHLSAEGGWMLVQFHPSYAYDDFVQGITASVNEQTKTPQFSVRNGTFIRACDFASQTDQLVFLIIDEINRGDLSKILGELIYALEYRSEPVALRIAQDMPQQLSIPKNLVVIGTMNSADRSISHIDYAIRRRFAFVTLSPDRSVIESSLAGKPVVTRALQLFDAVAELLKGNPAYSVGHSYFLAETPEALATEFVFKVLPLLDEYRREGIIDDTASVQLDESWPGASGIPIHHDRPFELLEQLRNWINGTP